MAAQDIQTLLLRVEASTELARRELAKMDGDFDKFTKRSEQTASAAESAFSKIGGGAALAKTALAGFVAAFSIDAISNEIKQGLEYASSLGEVSQQLGVTTETLQVYRYAATQAGISQEEIEKGLQRLTREIGKNNKAFGELGIATTDSTGKSRDTGDVFRDLAEKLSAIEDPAKRAAIEVQLFGKSGQVLDTILSEGAKGIDGYAQAAAELGLVLDDVAIKKADDANDKLSALNQVLSANIAGAVADNATVILRLADAIIAVSAAAARGTSNVVNYFRGLAEVSKQYNGSGGLLDGLVLFQAGVDVVGTAEFGKKSALFADIMGGDLRANGLPGFDARQNQRTGIPNADTARTTAAPRGGRSGPAALTPAQIRAGFGDRLSDLPNIGPSVLGDGPLANLGGISEQLQTITTQAVDLSNIDIFSPETLAVGDALLQDLSFGLTNAIAFSDNLGDALVQTFERAGLAMIQSGILNFLSGGKEGVSFGDLFKSVGAIFGGARAEGGPVMGGRAYLVGERGPEIVVPGMSGTVIPNHALRAGGRGGGGTVQNFDLRGAVVTEQLYRQMQAIGVQAAQAGAVGGKQMAAADRARTARRTAR